MFDVVRIAVVAGECMGIPLSPGMAALLFVERGTESTLARYARIVLQATYRLCRRRRPRRSRKNDFRIGYSPWVT